MASPILSNSLYSAFSSSNHVLANQPTNAQELDLALERGQFPNDKNFILKWTASKPLSAESLDLLMAERFYDVSPQLYYNLSKMVCDPYSLDDYVSCLITHRVSLPREEGLSCLIALGVSIDNIQAAMRFFGLQLSCRELALAGKCVDPRGLMELCRLTGVQPDGQVTVKILSAIRALLKPKF